MKAAVNQSRVSHGESILRLLGLDFKSDPVLSWLLIIALLHAIGVFLIGLDATIFDKHTFRQSQTAISAYWILQGGPWLAYETPVLGYPWSIPMEFPTYQLLVAAIAGVSDGSVIESGRLVSFLFFIALVPVIGTLGRLFDISDRYLRVFFLFYLLSPMYLFWGRTVMIESAAVFFSLAWLLGLVVQFRKDLHWRWMFVCLIAGSLAALTKITTFFPFAIAGALFVLHDISQMKTATFGKRTGLLLLSAVIAFVPLVMLVGWVALTDDIKQQNLLGQSLTSTTLQNWNYGTLQQRLSLGNWWVLIERAFKNTLGPGVIVLLVAAFYLKLSRAEQFRLAALLMCWLAAFLVFFNLHVVHDYYQYANTLFLLAVFAWLMFRILEDFKPRKAWTILGVVALVSVATFYNSYFSKFFKSAWFLDVTNHVKQAATSQQAIVTFGFDWSAHVAFYSERKSISFPAWASNDDMRMILSDLERYLGGKTLGAVVVDIDQIPENQKPLLDQLLKQRSPQHRMRIENYAVYSDFQPNVSAPGP